jgi:hypothetical protein
MRRQGPRAAVRGWVVAAWAMAGGAGCQLFMNLDVSGYDAAPTGDGAACGGDGAACVSIACIASSDCDGGQICCLGIAPTGPLSAIAACQAGPCGPTSIQLCRTDAECGSAGSCSPCTVGGVSLSVCDSTLTAFTCSP